MATSQKEFKQIPEIDFKVSSTGITVLCSRFYTPRFIQFDITGKCESCRADSAEIDFLVTIDGVTIYCSRMRQPIFVPFDYRNSPTQLLSISCKNQRKNFQYRTWKETSI